jgi:hypothetical protein
MTDERKSAKDTRQLPELGEDLKRNEIMAVLADDGYSAGGRKGWLKTVLTRLAQEQPENPDANRAKLVEEIKDILNENVSGDSEAEDTL